MGQALVLNLMTIGEAAVRAANDHSYAMSGDTIHPPIWTEEHHDDQYRTR